MLTLTTTNQKTLAILLPGKPIKSFKKLFLQDLPPLELKVIWLAWVHSIKEQEYFAPIVIEKFRVSIYYMVAYCIYSL